jgi:hypothetical protein
MCKLRSSCSLQPGYCTRFHLTHDDITKQVAFIQSWNQTENRSWSWGRLLVVLGKLWSWSYSKLAHLISRKQYLDSCGAATSSGYGLLVTFVLGCNNFFFF